MDTVTSCYFMKIKQNNFQLLQTYAYFFILTTPNEEIKNVNPGKTNNK